MSERAVGEWVDSGAFGTATMSQRNAKWAEANGGIDRRGIQMERV